MTRKRPPGVSLDGVAGFEDLSPLGQYDAAIREIAAKAPIRICEGELVSGAATLGLAIGHVIPATRNGKAVCGSVSHLTLDFGVMLGKGLRGLRDEAREALARHAGTEREPFARSCVSCLDSFSVWHRRYLEALEGRPEYADNLEALRHVPEEPARTFREALQSLWFTFAFVRLCGNWPGIGRLDVLLGPYLEADLAAGCLTLDEARELLAHFLIKGCEWISGGNYGSGDAQHYQNIVLGGIGVDGEDVVNAVTWLTLDVLEELGISDFPTTVRLNRNSDPKLLRRVAEVMRFGGGILAIYNEDLVVESLTGYGYGPDEARAFANDGCWEVQIPGATCFQYIPFDALGVLQHKTLRDYAEDVVFPDFESL